MMDAQEVSLALSEDSTEEPENKLFDVGLDKKPASANNNKRLTEMEAMAQCVLFFLAGQETTLTTLTFAAYQLALNPAIQEKLRKEVDECIAANARSGAQLGRHIEVEIPELRSLGSATLAAPPWLERCGSNDYVLGDTGMKLPSGCTVIIPVYSIHHDPEFFSDPECFKPDRFSEENVGSIRPYTYLPFGAGPRNCIGSRFVLQSIKMCLLHSVHSVQFTKTDKTKKTSLLEYGDGQIDSTDV
ncbi:hypothetical protein HPB52_020906 [Rhipicephalus sanguineus]|uniref:Cytochrome P450 n=1 Tax=Rhipicephalus sanguineus TaxID=34632 RepID=A0A9D4PUZ8_RHISA|nr:hypothetical protein HPB52_020906 [Rhipicephalus sanguineus]